MMVKLKEKWGSSTSSNTFMNTATPSVSTTSCFTKATRPAVLGTAVPSYDEINVNKVSDHLPDWWTSKNNLL
ncbi:MAG: hypothetical protein ACLTSJ_09945 [Alistipes communis]